MFLWKDFIICLDLNTKAKVHSDNCGILRYFPEKSKLEVFQEVTVVMQVFFFPLLFWQYAVKSVQSRADIW